MTDVEITHAIIVAAIAVHKEVGPGLLENVYEECMCFELGARNLEFERQKPLPVVYRAVKLDCGYRADIVVMRKVVVEIKAVAAIAPIHDAVMLTYLRLSGCRTGLLVNFHSVALKDGIKRYVWGYPDSSDEERH